VLSSRELYYRPSDLATDTNRIYISTHQDLLLHANTAHTEGRYASNQQLYDLVYTGSRNIPDTLSTLQLPATEVVANLIDVQAKCHALSLSRCLKRLQTEGTFTAAWLKLRNAHFYVAKALDVTTIPTRFPYWQLFFTNMLQDDPAIRHTTGKDHSTSIYAQLRAVKHGAPQCEYPYSVQEQSDHRSGGTNTLFQTTTYCAPRGIKTWVRLLRLHHQSFSERTYSAPQTLYFFDCRYARNYWQMALEKGQTCRFPAHWLSLHPHHVVDFPNMAMRSRPKQSASFWILGHMVYFVINSNTAIKYIDYINCIHQSPWKTCMWWKGVLYCGNYLDIRK
jgi:hypothetical protein